MAFISELAGRPATDFDGTQIGALKDLMAHAHVLDSARRLAC